MHDVLWRHKNVSTERHISNAYKKGHSCFKLCFMSFWGEICVCYRLASGVSADGLKFATRTYIKREFDTKMSKTKFTKLAKWARKKKIWCRSVVLDNFLGAMVLGSLQWLCRGVLLLLHIVEGLDGVYWLENNGHFLILIRE